MDCPKVSDITDETQKLPYKKKLQLLEKDAQTLLEFCLAKRMSSHQTKSCVLPFIGKGDSIFKRIKDGSVTSMFKLSMIVAVMAVLVKWPTSHNMITVHLKLLSMKTIPFWDWTKYYKEDCVIDNPFLPEKVINERDCFGCANFTKYGEIDRMKNVNLTVITDDYLYADGAYIVTDPVKDWPHDENNKLMFSLDKIIELYINHKSLKKNKGCEFFSTMEEVTDIHGFIDLLNKKKLPIMYHAAWDNCHPEGAKVFRLITKRPYFIPAMAEASKANQIIVAKGDFDPDLFQIPQQPDSAVWMVLVSGTMNVTLVPRTECEKFKCKEVNFLLKTGQAIVVPSRTWSLSYTPTSDSVMLAFASSVIWDDVS